MGAGYIALEAPTRMTLLNGTRTDYRYYDEPGIDQSQRLRQLTVTKNGTVLLDLTYSYDAVSNLTVLHEMTPYHGEHLTFSYDAFNRLRTASGDTYSASYTYDRLDRLASVTEGGYSTIFGVWTTGTEANTPGQPRHAPRYIGNPSNQFGYDPAGNMIIRWLKQGGTYTASTQKFNVDNRLYQVIGTGTTTTYDLDAHTGTTLRRTQTSGGSTTVTDFVLRYYQKNVTAGTGTVSYYFGDRLVAQLSTKRTFLHGDHLGSTVLVTDGQGGSVDLPALKILNRQQHAPQHIVSARFDDAAVLWGYDLELPAASLKPGSSFTLTLYYRSEKPTTVDYTQFVYLYNPGLEMAAQHDAPPQAGGNPTSAWIPGEGIANPVILTVADDAHSGLYSLLVGLYTPDAGGARLSVRDAAGSPLPEHQVLLTELRVEESGPTLGAFSLLPAPPPGGPRCVRPARAPG